ncbi:hypothetical protein KI387_033158, partial [Taxus chinensis]
MSLNDYNHHLSTNEKEMALVLVSPTNKMTPEGFPIYDDDIKFKLEKLGLLQLFDFPYFGKPECLYQWLMSHMHEYYFHFVGCKMRITPQLISHFTGLIFEGDSLEDNSSDKEEIKETVVAYAYKKGLRYFDITDIKDLVMKIFMHLVTKINGH